MPSDQPPYDALDPVTLAVRDLVGASRQLLGRIARAMGMNVNDMAAIEVLDAHGPMGAAELADHLGIRSASASVLVDRLEGAGHVVRVRDTTDRRRVRLSATAASRDTTYDAWAPVITSIDDVCRALPADERVVVERFLAAITEATQRGGRTA